MTQGNAGGEYVSILITLAQRFVGVYVLNNNR